jgi:hypothetical protein
MTDDVKATPKPKRSPLPAGIFARLVLALVGLIWLGVGVTALGDPTRLAGSVDFQLPSDLARFEFRAMYGGLSIAIAIIHLLGVFRARWIRPCLVFALATLIGLASGRIISIGLGDVPGGFGFLLLVVELTGIALAVFAYARMFKADRTGSGVVIEP